MLRPRFISAAAFIALAVLVAAIFGREPEHMVAGAARAVDGDSLRIGGRDLRLKGIDAPELRQMCKVGVQSMPCGRQARAALLRWLERAPPTCSGSETDRYGRLLVTCRVNGVDINADLVRNGHAVAYGGYEAEEREARQFSRGIWGTDFETPELFRRRMREMSPR